MKCYTYILQISVCSDDGTKYADIYTASTEQYPANGRERLLLWFAHPCMWINFPLFPTFTCFRVRFRKIQTPLLCRCTTTTEVWKRGLSQFSCSYLWDPFMFMAGNWHHVRPIGWRHDNSGNLSTGDVEGSGTFLMWALDASATVLTGGLAVAKHTFLRWEQKIDVGCWVRSETNSAWLNTFRFDILFDKEIWAEHLFIEWKV